MPAKTFAVTYSYVPDMLERRAPHRPDHLAHLQRARDEGRLVMAGAFADPVDGALLIAEAEHQGEVLAWVADDPYVRAGLIVSVAIREWSLAIGRAPGAPAA